MVTGDANTVNALVDEVVTAVRTDQVSEAHLANLSPAHWLLVASELADQVSKLENQTKTKPQHSLIAQIRNAATGDQKGKSGKAR